MRTISLLCLTFVLMSVSCQRKGTPNNSVGTENNNQVSDNDSPCIDVSKIDPSVACLMVYEPVCGCDGKNYSNACVAESNGVLRWEQGECPTAP